MNKILAALAALVFLPAIAGLSACASGGPPATFAKSVYTMKFSYFSGSRVLSGSFAFTADRSRDRLVLTVTGRPVLREAYPRDTELSGFESAFANLLEGSYSFDAERYPKGQPAKPFVYDFRTLLAEPGPDLKELPILRLVGAPEEAQDQAVDALLAAIMVGIGCPDLDTPQGFAKYRSKSLDVVTDPSGYYSYSTQTLFDDKASIVERSVSVASGVSRLANPDSGEAVLNIHLLREGASPAPTLTFADPPASRWPHHLRTKEGWTLPRIDGSTATIPLSVSAVAGLLGISPGEAKSYVTHNKTHEAFVNLVEGRCDIAFVTEPSPEELDYAREKGVELSIVPVAREGFVFLVNAANPVESLSLDAIREIYRGYYGNWAEIGGEKERIIAYVREPNSGSQTLFEKLVLPRDEIDQGDREIEGMGELIEGVAHPYPDESPGNEDKVPSLGTGAIGFSVFYYATEMKANPEVRLLAVNGVLPTTETILYGTYPLLSAYYAVTRAQAPEAALNLLRWLQGGDGTEALKAANYIPYVKAKGRG